jgi:hypothetical protein
VTETATADKVSSDAGAAEGQIEASVDSPEGAERESSGSGFAGRFLESTSPEVTSPEAGTEPGSVSEGLLSDVVDVEKPTPASSPGQSDPGTELPPKNLDVTDGTVPDNDNQPQTQAIDSAPGENPAAESPTDEGALPNDTTAEAVTLLPDLMAEALQGK